jgi:tight adherence protein B
MGIVLALAWPGSTKRERIRQIGLFGPGRARGRGAGPAPTTSQIALTALAASAAVVRSRGMESRITLGLEQAGMRLRPPEWLLLRACGAAVGAALLFLLTLGQGWLAGVISIVAGLALGWIGTGLYRTARADRRINRFADRLPDALQLVIGSLRSGFSLPQALDSLVNESAEPVASEFGRALAENRLGADLADALENVVKRTKSDDLAWAVMAVRIQREVGGNLAEVLQTTVDTIRERSRVRRHVRALSAEGRLSAWVLVVLPVLISALLVAFRRDYLRPLFSEPIGIAMLLGGMGLLVLGVFWMMRVIRVQA